MSAFHPGSYEEARATHKPMTRRKPLKTVGQCDSSSGDRKVSTRAHSAPKQPIRRKKARRIKVSTLKNRAWVEFSIFIRTRHADAEGMVACCTCGVKKPWKKMQAGHFIAGRLNGNLFEERGCHAQCGVCNVIKAGNGPRYYQFMQAAYGQAVIDELLRQNNETRKWLPGELQSIAEKYRALNEANPLTKEKAA